MEDAFCLRRLRKASDRDAVLRAVAPRGERGAAPTAALPRVEIASSYGVDPDAIDLGVARGRGTRAASETVALQPHRGSGAVETRRAMGQFVRDDRAAHDAGRILPTPVN